MNNQRLKTALNRWWVAAERARWQYGKLGRLNADASVTVVAGRQNFVYVTLDTGTLTEAYNKGNGAVPLRAGLPVRVRQDAGRLIIDGEDTSGVLEGDANAPGQVYAVNGQTGYVTLDPDDLDDAATTHKFTTAADIAKLAGIAAGAEVNVNADWSAVSGDALILNKPTIPTVPVKATGAEVDTGTDDAKFVTAKAMEDSSYIKAAYADAKVTDAIVDAVTTVAPSQNAVFDALATKQGLDATLTSIAALGTAADKMLYTTGVDTWAELATLAYGRSLLAATNIAAAQTTLALVPGTNVQAYDATLLSIAALGTAADRMLYTTGVDTWAEVTTTSYGRSLLASAAAINARATLGLVIGTDVQAQDAELAAIAGLTSAADRLPYFTGLGTAALATFTAFGRTMAALADAAAGRTALALGTIATMAESLFVLLGGRTGGQVVNGGDAANDDLTLRGTAHATKTSSYVLLQDTGGKVGIGALLPHTFLSIFGTPDANWGQLNLGDDRTAQTGIGGVIAFTGYKTTTSAEAIWVKVSGKKENNTAGNEQGYYIIEVNDGSAYVERMRITSAGLMGIGTDVPQGKQHVYDGTGGKLFKSVTGVVGSEVELIADGTGDVVKGCNMRGIATGSGGTVTNISTGTMTTPGAGSTTLAVGNITFKLYSTGQLVVLRSIGVETYAVTVDIIWQ